MGKERIEGRDARVNGGVDDAEVENEHPLHCLWKGCVNKELFPP